MNQDEVVTTLVVRDEKFEVTLHVNRDNTASFRVDMPGTFISEETLKGVYDKLMRETKKAKVTVEVPFTTRGDLKPGVATGVHAGSGNITARVESYGRERPEQISSLGADAFVPLNQEQRDELRRLRKAKHEAERAVEDYERPLKLDLRKAVREAIKVKTDEALAAEAKS